MSHQTRAASAPSGTVPRSERSLIPWIVGGVVGLLLVTLTLIAVADWGARTAEMRTLVADIEASETAMVVTNDELTGLFEELGNATTPDEQQKVLARIGELAGQRAGILAEADRRITNLRIAPWHRGVERARTAYLAHNRAWQEYLRAGAADPTTLFREFPAIEQTWNELKEPLRAAVPWPDVFGLLARVNALLADGDPPAEDPGGEASQAGQPVMRSPAA